MEPEPFNEAENPFKNSAANVPPARIPVAEVAQTLGIHYDPERSCFWAKNDRDNWIRINNKDVVRILREMGYHSIASKGETCSETDRIVNQIQRTMDVEYAASLAGHPKGILNFRGHRLLIVDSPVFIVPSPGEWGMLRRFIINLLGPEQTRYFYGWLKIALESLYNRKFRPGQALVLAGPKDCGKSLLQILITILFGGRNAKPYQYMSKGTPFNGDLFCAEHLMMEDEIPATDIKSRRNFGTKIKEIAANISQRCHFKFLSGLTLEPFWRLTISINDETENLMILPPWDDSIEDKIMLFKTERHEMEMPTATIQEYEIFRNALITMLPGLVDHLFTWEMPKDLVSQRYGATHYHHPELLEALGALAPEIRLLDFIDREIFGLHRTDPPNPQLVKVVATPPDKWEGTSTALDLRLIDDLSSVRFAARNLLSWQGACGTYLGRLERKYPKRITYKRHEHIRIWTIKRP